jgi:hypothetical protein
VFSENLGFKNSISIRGYRTCKAELAILYRPLDATWVRPACEAAEILSERYRLQEDYRETHYRALQTTEKMSREC